MAQIDLDGYNSRLYINELRSQSTSTIVIPSSTTLVVDTLSLTNLKGDVTLAAGYSISITDTAGLSMGGVPIKAGGVKTWENKSSTFTAVAGSAYIVDTTSGAFDVSLPNGPSYGDTVVFLDAAGLFATNNMTLLGNGEKVVRVVGQDLAVDEDDTYIEMVYSGTSFGWLVGATNLVL